MKNHSLKKEGDTMKEILRRTWAEINLDALAADFQAVRDCTGEKSLLCCVIKADAYGHGAIRMAREFEALGADWFAVSNVEEALQLRNAGVKKPVLVLGFTPAEEAGSLARYDISQCVFSLDYARELSLYAQRAEAVVKIHVKVDTGMGRLGFCYRDFVRDAATLEEIREACTLPGLYPQGAFTHFASADEGTGGDAFTMRQFGCFKELLEALQREGITFDIRHCANSGAVLDYPLSHLDMVRAGVILYGLYPSAQVRRRPELQPVLSLRSVVSHVKTVHPGETVSYGRDFTAAQELRAATIPVGYADGYPRLLSPGGAQVLIHGVRCPILGRICMDQMVADVTALSHVKPGDTVTLIGRDGEASITADDIAAWEGTINYEVVCALSKRVPRVYIKGGNIDSVYNQLI